LISDALNEHIGAVLEQVVDGERQPLDFYSKKLSGSESLWLTYNRELLAIYEAVQNYEYLLEGCEVVLVTDHKPLISMFKMKRRQKIEGRS